ncbi:hypothetical protein D2Q93_00525 [Alicyclobacillaceae bacterium I2511]|nr:hypothetical protein D2Q93_00525 [Alicyclobacillaceae bacterium I2511]
MQMAAVYGVLLLIALVLFWLTRHRSGSVSLEETSFSRGLSRVISAIAKRPGPAPAEPSNRVQIPSLQEEIPDSEMAVAVLQDLYAEFQQDSAVVRKDFSNALSTLHQEISVELAALKEQVTQLHNEIERVRTTMADSQIHSPVGAVTSSLMHSEGSSPDTPEGIHDTPWLILTALQEGLADDEIAIRYSVSQTEIDLVRRLLLMGDVTAE